MNILVLGGNGFIGQQLTKELIKNHFVRIVDINDKMPAEFYRIENIEYRKIDFINHDDFTDVLDGMDVVIHLVSTLTPNDNIDSVGLEINNNILPTIRLLDSMKKSNTKKILFISSGGTVYGNHDKNPISENECLNPISNYGIIKETIEKYMLLYNNYANIDSRIIRLANPYSEYTKKGKMQGIIPLIIDRILKDEEITIWGDGRDVRDYIYILDAINAIISILKYTGNERVFNVGTGKGYSVNEILHIICKSLNVPFESLNLNYIEARKCDVDNNILDINRIKKETGWKPKVKLEDGINKVIVKKLKKEH